LAALDAAAGDRASAVLHLEGALATEPLRLSSHVALEALTGRAPPGGDARAAARGHPYDPRARLAAGRAALMAGHLDAAREELESTLVLADLDPAAADESARLLASAFPDWRDRRVVPVRIWADEPLRADPGWRFQQRYAWLLVSQALDPLLATRFVVVSIGAFASEGAGFDLPPIAAAAREQIDRLPSEGIVAFATGRAIPRAGGRWKQGEAEFLGRVLSVRLAPREVASRVLAHELIHLYGGVHVNPDVASLMNPSGESNAIDPVNAAILRALRTRRFGPGGIEANVVAVVPLAPAIRAFEAALRANLALRQAGVVEALAEAEGSLRAAAPAVRKALALDDHLADVAAFTGDLLVRDGRPRAASRLYALAADLYGPASPRGRRARDRARHFGGVG
jgi:tetratricopeptide (TPR) repeat protein